jgi:hypothetical protein
MTSEMHAIRTQRWMMRLVEAGFSLVGIACIASTALSLGQM